MVGVYNHGKKNNLYAYTEYKAGTARRSAVLFTWKQPWRQRVKVIRVTKVTQVHTGIPSLNKAPTQKHYGVVVAFLQRMRQGEVRMRRVPIRESRRAASDGGAPLAALAVCACRVRIQYRGSRSWRTRRTRVTPRSFPLTPSAHCRVNIDHAAPNRNTRRRPEEYSFSSHARSLLFL